jgi:hypothetical protein
LLHIPLKTTIDYDASLPFETVQKQPLAMSKFLFSDRRQSTPCSRSLYLIEWLQLELYRPLLLRPDDIRKEKTNAD